MTARQKPWSRKRRLRKASAKKTTKTKAQTFGRKQKVREYVREQLELTTIETRRAMGEDV